jgi:secreted Zn-dependent insulinase-like peptidase
VFVLSESPSSCVRAETQATLDGARFDNFRKGLIARKLQPDTNLSEESTRHWGEIKARRYEFDYLIKETNFAASLTHADFVAFYVDRVLGGSSGSRKMLATWITASDSCRSDIEPPVDAIVVDKDADLSVFRASQAYYRRPAPPALGVCL